jgi:hypothetical protein
MKKLISGLIDCIFPPLCLECEEMTTDPFFCKNCWEYYSLIDPEFRCHHCFAMLEEDSFLCPECRHGSRFPIPRAFVLEKHSSISHLWQQNGEYKEAFGAFFFLQWIRLKWPTPHLIVILPGMRKVGPAFADLMEKPYIFIGQDGEGNWKGPIDAIEEGQVVLFLDEGILEENLYEAVRFFNATFPKRGYSLSLMHDPFIHDPHSDALDSLSCLSRH